MSTTLPSQPSKSPSVQRPNSANPADEFVSLRVAEACRALWWEEVIRRTLMLIIWLILCVLVWVVIDQWVYSSGRLVRAVAFALIAGASAWYVLRRIVPVLTSSVRPEYAARALERDLPEMKQELTSYIMLRDASLSEPSAGATANRLHERVVRSIGSIAAGRLRQHDALPSEATSTLRWWIVAAGALALLMAYTVFSPKSTIASAGRLIAPLAKIQPAKRVTILDVQPGDVEAIAGRTVAVSAKIDGLRESETPVCRWKSSNRDNQFELTYNSESRRFEGGLQLSHSDANQIPYTIYAGDDESQRHWLSVKNLPVVAIESVRYEPPAYTGEVAHTSSSASVSAVDGTSVTITAKTNRPVVRADIEFNPKTLGETVRATAGSKSMHIDAEGTNLTITFPLRNNLERSAAVQLDSYRIRVRDDADQDNPEPIIYPIRVIADLPPEISIVLPRKSPKSMGVELQQIIEIHAMDPDFGLTSVELKIRRGIDVIKNPTLWSNDEGAKGNQVTEYRFRPSEHGLRVGDVVQITGVATDNRNVPGDDSIKANVSETDSVEIRIVDDQPAPDPQGADDGLSETDQRPASDHPEDNAGGEKSASQDGDQKQGGSGGKGESGQQQQGDGGSESGQAGEGQGSEGENGESQKGESQGSDSQGAKGESKGTQNDAGDSGSDSSGNPQEMNEDSQGKPKGDSSGSSGEGNPGSEGAQGNPSPDQQSGDQSGERMSEKDTSQSGDQKAGDSGAEGTGERSEGADGSESQSADGPPKHDGEAFEKIRDYLENKKKNDQKKPASQQDDPSKSDDSQGNAKGEEQNADSDPKNAGGDESGKNDSMDDGKKPDGSSSDDQADNEKSDGSQSAGAKPDGKDPRDNQSESAQGDSPDGKSGADSETPKDKQGSPSGKGEQDQNANGDKSDQGSGETGSDPQGSKSDQMSDDSGNGEGQGTEQGSDDAGSPKQDSRDAASGDQTKGNGEEEGQGGKGDQQSGDQSGSEKGSSGDQAGSDQAGDESQTGEGNQSSANDDSPSSGDSMSPKEQGQQSKSQGDEEPKPGSKQDPSPNGQPGEQNSPTGDLQNGPSSQSGDPRTGKPQNNTQQNGNTQGGDSSAAGSDSGTGEVGEGPLAPEAADLEYTKKATDMVLDYLEETRDAPDRELLDKLDWSENDLKKFAERWKQTRQMDSPAADPKQQDQLRDALESLGLRPPAGDARDVRREKADDLRAIRDSGNRRPPPAAYKDVFDAYRRGLGRQK